MDTANVNAEREVLEPEVTIRHENIAEKFIRGNYFYVLSAVLMMLGCYMLMRSPVIEGDKFTKTLKTLLILQAYELLLIITAVVIVRRLKILDDAFTLLLLEMILLLDPTFFANSFFTLPGDRGDYVNIICFFLVPIKLIVLVGALRLRLSPRMWAAFMAACAIVLLAEGPMTSDPPPLGLNGYYYLLAWTPLIVALLLPPMGSMFALRTEKEGYITENQNAFFPRFLMAAPVVIAAAHFIESSYVHTVRYYPMHTVPLLMAIAALIIHNTDPKPDREIRTSNCFAIDALVAFAFFLSIPYRAFTGKMASLLSYTGPPPAFVTGWTPIVIAGAAAIAAYSYFHVRLDYRPALVRAVVLAVIGGLGLLVKVAAPIIQSAWTKLVPHFQAGASAAPDWLWEHFTKPGILACALLLVIAVKSRKLWAWFIFGGATACWFLNLLPAHWYASMPVMPENLIIVALVLDHLLLPEGNKNRRYTIAAGLVAFGIVRYLDSPAPWTFGVAVAEAAVLVAAGWLLRYPYYSVAGAFSAVALAFACVKRSGIQPHPSVLVVAGGLASFLVGLVVTFHKQRILGWLEPACETLPPDEPPPPPPEDEPDYLTIPEAEPWDNYPPDVPSDEDELPDLPDDEAQAPPEDILEEPAKDRADEEKPESGAPGQSGRSDKSDASDTSDSGIDAIAKLPNARIIMSDDMEPSDLVRIVADANVKANETMMVCVREGDTIDEWFAILTNERLIVRRESHQSTGNGEGI